MQILDLKTLSCLLCINIHDLRDWAHYSQFFECFKYLKAGINLHSDSFYA